MPELNLLKNELRESRFSFGEKSYWALYVMLTILAFEIVVYAGLFFYGKQMQSQSRKVEQQVASLDFEVGKVDEQRTEAVSFQRRINNLQILLDNHIFWTPIFEELEKYTLKGARYSTLQMQQADAKLIVTGIVPSYTDLGKLILGLRQSANLLDVNLQTTAVADEELSGFTFNMEILLDPKVFTK